jgi:hypothetical protein
MLLGGGAAGIVCVPVSPVEIGLRAASKVIIPIVKPSCVELIYVSWLIHIHNGSIWSGEKSVTNRKFKLPNLSSKKSLYMNIDNKFVTLVTFGQSRGIYWPWAQ